MGKAARLKAERRLGAVRSVGVQVSQVLQHQAAHEAGHAVVQWTLGLPFDYVSLDTSPPGLWPLAGVKQHLGDRWLIGAAGCIADYQSRSLLMPDSEIVKLILGSPDGRFTVVDHSGAVAVRPDRGPAVMAGADLYLMAVVMSDDGEGSPWPASEIVAVWRECERYVAACRRAIDKVASALLLARKLTYAETTSIAADAMAGLPRSAVPEWFEDARQLSLRLEAQVD